MDDESKRAALELLRKLVNCEFAEDEEAAVIEKLERLVVDPQLLDYVFQEDMSPEDALALALQYKPVVLG